MASPRARNLRKNPTEAESRLWRALRRRQVGEARFRRQVPIGPYVVDFVCFSAKLVVEVDGGQHAMQPGHDVRRDEWFTARGYRTLRFWNNQVFDNLDGVIDMISAALESPPHPGPPPPGGRE